MFVQLRNRLASHRLVTWNCAMALRNKWEQLISLAPNVAVIQECETEGRCSSDAYTSAVRCGSNEHKGSAIIALGPWTVEECEPLDPTIEFVLPARISGPKMFNVLGVWAKQSEIQGPSYIGQMLHAADVYAACLAGSDSVVVGDWNSNARFAGATGEAYLATIAQLAECGMTSAYRHHHRCRHVRKRHATWYNHKQAGHGYHIDYCFVPQA
jgi:exodeoxyribonuclease III